MCCGVCACLCVALYFVVIAVTNVLSHNSILMFWHENILHIISFIQLLALPTTPQEQHVDTIMLAECN